MGKVINNRCSPQLSTTNSKMVSWLPASISGRASFPCLTRNSSILARSSISSRAPTPHMRAKTKSRLKWFGLRTPCSSLLGIRPSSMSIHCKMRTKTSVIRNGLSYLAVVLMFMGLSDPSSVLFVYGVSPQQVSTRPDKWKCV